MDTQAPLANADLSNTQGLTLEALTQMHEEHATAVPAANEPHNALHEEHWQTSHEKAAPEQDLKRALELELEHDTFQLDQKDDLTELSQRAVTLFQKTLPETMSSLSKTLHAREQISLLYDRLSDLSENRGAAANIIQTARQIENLESILHQEQVSSESLLTVQAEVQVLNQILQRYDQVFTILQTRKPQEQT